MYGGIFVTYICFANCNEAPHTFLELFVFCGFWSKRREYRYGTERWSCFRRQQSLQDRLDTHEYVCYGSLHNGCVREHWPQIIRISSPGHRCHRCRGIEPKPFGKAICQSHTSELLLELVQAVRQSFRLLRVLSTRGSQGHFWKLPNWFAYACMLEAQHALVPMSNYN
jgi:hypothetical protein